MCVGWEGCGSQEISHKTGFLKSLEKKQIVVTSSSGSSNSLLVPPWG